MKNKVGSGHVGVGSGTAGPLTVVCGSSDTGSSDGKYNQFNYFDEEYFCGSHAEN